MDFAQDAVQSLEIHWITLVLCLSSNEFRNSVFSGFFFILLLSSLY